MWHILLVLSYEAKPTDPCFLSEHPAPTFSPNDWPVTTTSQPRFRLAACSQNEVILHPEIKTFRQLASSDPASVSNLFASLYTPAPSLICKSRSV